MRCRAIAILEGHASPLEERSSQKSGVYAQALPIETGAQVVNVTCKVGGRAPAHHAKWIPELRNVGAGEFVRCKVEMKPGYDGGIDFFPLGLEIIGADGKPRFKYGEKLPTSEQLSAI